MTEPPKTRHNCENCWFRRRAEARPNSWLARFWQWHTTWCPGWRAYQKDLAEQADADKSAD